MTTYKDRPVVTSFDGSRLVANADDSRNEQIVAKRLETAWGCIARRYPQLNPIDFYLERNDALVGYAEIKFRSHSSDKYPTVFLNTRKYMHLLSMWLFTGAPACFVVGFGDGRVGWIAVRDVVCGSTVRVVDVRRSAQIFSDREPVIEVPISSLTFLSDEESAA
jgi:hypothetical protein